MNGSRVRKPSFSISVRKASANSGWRGAKAVLRSLRYSVRRFLAIRSGFIEATLLGHKISGGRDVAGRLKANPLPRHGSRGVLPGQPRPGAVPCLPASRAIVGRFPARGGGEGVLREVARVFRYRADPLGPREQGGKERSSTSGGAPREWALG